MAPSATQFIPVPEFLFGEMRCYVEKLARTAVDRDQGNGYGLFRHVPYVRQPEPTELV